MDPLKVVRHLSHTLKYEYIRQLFGHNAKFHVSQKFLWMYEVRN